MRAFYSRKNTKTPAILNVFIFMIFVGFSYTLSRFLQAPGIALALSTAYVVLALASLALTRREIGRVDGRRIAVSLFKALSAGAVMYALAVAGTELLSIGGSVWERLAVLALVGGVSTATYLGVTFILRSEELGYVLALLRKRRGYD